MKIKHKRILALLLLAAMVIGIAPSVLAVGDSAASSAEPAVESSGESAGTQGASSAETNEPRIAPPEATELTPVEEDTGDDDVPRSEDGETLTRDEELLAPSLLGISLFAANSTGTVSKSTCVNFAQYQSPTWYCNRYYTEGSHSYGHYFYASTIAYHAVNGERAYCIEPNTTSLDGQTYTSYEADSASSTSFWMRELDSTQRDLITKILACGYPQVDYGYTTQQQYAATQTLIWEVCCKTRYASGIRYCTDYGGDIQKLMTQVKIRTNNYRIKFRMSDLLNLRAHASAFDILREYIQFLYEKHERSNVVRRNLFVLKFAESSCVYILAVHKPFPS